MEEAVIVEPQEAPVEEDAAGIEGEAAGDAGAGLREAEAAIGLREVGVALEEAVYRGGRGFARDFEAPFVARSLLCEGFHVGDEVLDEYSAVLRARFAADEGGFCRDVGKGEDEEKDEEGELGNWVLETH